MNVGVLSFQGAISAHLDVIRSIGANPIKVNSKETLLRCERLIIPGGESTTMIKLIESSDMWEDLQIFCQSNPCYGTCAGAILLAKKVSNPWQKSLGVIDILAQRNAYGTQKDSFKAKIDLKLKNITADSIEVDFIRAPKLSPLNDRVNILASYKDSPVLLQQNQILVASFHSELSYNPLIHNYFLSI